MTAKSKAEVWAKLELKGWLIVEPYKGFVWLYTPSGAPVRTSFETREQAIKYALQITLETL